MKYLNFLSLHSIRKTSLFICVLLFNLFVSANQQAQPLDTITSWDDSLKTANGYLYEGAYEKSAAIALTIHQKAEAIDQKRYQAKSAFILGEIYRLRRESDKSVLYQSEAVQLYRILNDSLNIFKSKHNLSLSLELSGKPQMAVDTLLSLVNYTSFLKSTDSAKIYNNVGRICMLQEWDDQAEYYLEKAISLNRRVENKRGLIHNLNEMATLYLYTNRQLEGIKLGEEAYALIQQGVDKDIYVHHDVVMQLSSLYEEIGDPINALAYLKKQHVLIDSLNKRQKQEAFIEMQTRYETDKKEKELQLLHAKDQLQTRTRNALVGGILALIIVSFLIIYGLRVRVKRNQAEKRLVQSKNEWLTKDLANKEQQLIRYVQQVKKKNKILDDLTIELEQKEAIEKTEEKQLLFDKLIRAIILTQEDWEEFKELFEEVYGNFFTRLKFQLPDLTESEVRLAALTKLNLSTKEMGGMLGISPDSVKKSKYRLRKKLSEIGKGSLEQLISTN